MNSERKSLQRTTSLAEVKDQIDEQQIEVIRFSFADQHGVLRGKALMASELDSIVEQGCTMPSSLLLKDTSHRTAFPVWQDGAGLGLDEFSGAANVIMMPDLATFRPLPWAEGTAGVLCDLVGPDGTPNRFDSRQILRNAVNKLHDAGYDFWCGLEIELSIFKLDDPERRDFSDTTHPGQPPTVKPLTLGHQYLTDSVLDELDEIYTILRRNLIAIGLPLRSMEVEFGPSQCELTFGVTGALEAADDYVLFRTAVRQICRRHGYHATFMCRPALPNMMSNGWHLHQSITHVDSAQNAFAPDSDDQLLSTVGKQYVAGVLDHAAASCVFSTPTINGYKRFTPHTLAPDRLSWGRDNRGAMLRILSGVGDPASRIENRVGEPAANPYLFMASQILSGLDGIERELEPPAPTNEPYNDDAARLPAMLSDAVDCLDQSDFYRGALGDEYVDYMVRIKQFELDRFNAAVTDWEHQEYFSMF